MDILKIQYKTAQIENYQATFLNLKIDNELFRFDFIDKKEFYLKQGTIGQFNIYDTHPLLIDYNEEIITTYINSKPNNIDDFVSDFENAIKEVTKGWRSWTNYVEDKRINFTLDTFLNNIKKGTGKLLEAPFSITQKVIEVCDKHEVATKSFGSELKPDNLKLITIANNYVISREFKLHNTDK